MDITSSRVLAAGGGKVFYDYSSSMIASLTVTLILVVELLRHELDKYVHGKALASEVLESCYRELTTLGVVEFLVFLVHEIYPSFPLDVERQFATAHFALFATAIIYSIYVTLVAWISFNISGRWKEAEEMELDHYVEVRHAFEKLKTELSITSPPSLFHNLSLFFSHPYSSRRYHLLLQQIRFHKLRAHFVKSNNLPKDFPMAEYLNACQRNVLISLVELRQGTWLALLCVLILFFYFATLEEAIYLSPTGSLTRHLAAATSGTSSNDYFHITAFVFFEGFCLLVLVLGAAIKWKMDKIFSALMHDDTLIEPPSETFASTETPLNLQVDLFWRRSPTLIIVLYQYMCFVYSVLAGILAMYGPELNVTIPLSTWAGTFVLSTVLASYFMPKYTLCVSVGQLVDRSTLNESLSNYRLKKLQERGAKRRKRRIRKSKKKSKHTKEDSENSAVTFLSAGLKSISNKFARMNPLSPPPDVNAKCDSPELTPNTSTHVNNLVSSFSLQTTSASQPPQTSSNFTPYFSGKNNTTIDKSVNASFRTGIIPPTPEGYHDDGGKGRRYKEHHSNASIRWLDIANFADMETEDLPPSSTVAKKVPRTRVRRRKSVSDTAKILMMSAIKPGLEDSVSSPITSPSGNITEQDTEGKRRRFRRRSISDGVTNMRSPTSDASFSPRVTSPTDTSNTKSKVKENLEVHKQIGDDNYENQTTPQETETDTEIMTVMSDTDRKHQRLQSVCELNPLANMQSPMASNEVIQISSSASSPSSPRLIKGDYIPISTTKKKSSPTSYPTPLPLPDTKYKPTVTISIPPPTIRQSSLQTPFQTSQTPVSEFAFSPSASTVQSTGSSVATHVRVSECFYATVAWVAKIFHSYWRNTSHVITFATVFTLAARANYLVQFEYPNVNYAINFTSGNQPALIGTAFWFAASFLAVLILEGAVQIIRGNWARAVVDLPLTTTALTCILVSEANGGSEGNFGARYPWTSTALDYIPVIVIVRLFRVELSERIKAAYKHRVSNDTDRFATARDKSIKAQREFEESRSIKSYGAAAVIQDQHKTGTIVELWYKAVKTHANIVEVHGAFSGELLRAMLEIAEEKKPNEKPSVKPTENTEGRRAGEEAREGREESNDTSHNTSSTEHTADDSSDNDEDDDDDDYDYSYSDDGVCNDGNSPTSGRHRPTNSTETLALPTLPPSLPSNAIFHTASRRMPPLLTEWEECVFVVDREERDVAYFDVVTENFLGRIQICEVARVTLTATETKRTSMLQMGGGGFGAFLTGSNHGGNADVTRGQNSGEEGGFVGDVENPTELISPLSADGAVSLKSSASLRSRMGRYKTLTTMILLKQGNIMHVKFKSNGKQDGNAIARDFANKLCQVTGLVLLDGTVKRTSMHKKRISLKW
ncbi:hypothetical protein TrCOL_g10301 [Triparma columacea]|uniref:Uncharacterized protein n=1 Tax=Triparma columacea TaxID=722753 RepID=A0A9W7GG06_9STRA|nr:hypothetical protein TrCOL_g10301 [Triparma columacea]